MAEGVERRRHRRIPLRLPIECTAGMGEGRRVYRTITRNICSGGLAFEADSAEFSVGTPLEFQLQVPPGEGYFPSAGLVRGSGHVVRVDSISNGAHPAFAVAARFAGPLKPVF